MRFVVLLWWSRIEARVTCYYSRLAVERSTTSGVVHLAHPTLLRTVEQNLNRTKTPRKLRTSNARVRKITSVCTGR